MLGSNIPRSSVDDSTCRYHGKSVSVGRLHVCSITLDDELYCWGNDGYSGGPYEYDGLLSIPAGQTASCINSVCSVPNYVTISSPSDADCNDQDATVFPTNNEIPNNAIDDNCNGQIDETSSSNSISLDNANLAITLAAAAGRNCGNNCPFKAQTN